MLVFVEVVLLIGISPLTSEVLAPMMTEASVGLETFELSTSVYFMVAAVLHVVHGMCVNAAGSVSVGLYGTVLYTVASGVLVRTTTPETFLAFRAVQSAGASACTVVGFARTRERLSPMRDVPYSNACRSALLIVGPMISQGLLEWGGWRMPFLVLVCYGGIASGIVLANNLRQTPLPARRTVLAQDSVMAPPVDLALWGACDSCGFATMILWIVYAPVISDIRHFGVWYGLTFVGSAVGHLSTRWAARRVSRHLLWTTGAMLVCTGAGWWWSAEWHVVYSAMTVLNFARAGAASLCQTQIMLKGSRPGTTAALFHSARMVAAAVAVHLAQLRPWTAMVCCAALAFMIAIFITGPHRARDPSPCKNATATPEMADCRADPPLSPRVCVLLQPDAHDVQERAQYSRMDRPVRAGTGDGVCSTGMDGGRTADAVGHRDPRA